MTSAQSTEVLRFDVDAHQYVDVATGEILPSATQLLVMAGEVDEGFYSEESAERGTQVHRLTLDYDLGALEVEDVVTKYRGWLLAYDELTRATQRPEWLHLEEPFAHPVLRFACTPDRVGHVYKLLSVAEIKSGPYVYPKKRGRPGPHELQTALQAIAVANRLHIRPEMVARWGFYIQGDGKFKVQQFVNAADLRRAREIIREFCL